MNYFHSAFFRTAHLSIAACLAAGIALLGTASEAQAQSQTGFTYNGVAYTSYQSTEYLETPQGPNSAADMAGVGANYATVLATQYVSTYTSNTISAGSSTPTDAAVVAAITNLQAAGITPILKPQVDSYDGIWRGSFAPTDVSAWFASYQTFIVHYATIAQEQNLPVFVIGCEFKTLSGSAYQSNWDTIISAVRAVYTGKLAYAANATGAGDEFSSVSFWGQLDIIGVDGYVPLTDQANPTVAQLVSAWTNNASGFNAVEAFQNLQSTYPTKPLIFSEIGYVSAAGTNEAPYASAAANAAYDPTEQADCYQAFFQVFSQQTSWMKGVFWWDWTVSPPSPGDTGYSPQLKPAGNVLALWYGAPTFTIGSADPTLSVTQASAATDTITITPANGFTGDVTLAVSGLPTGVTAAFATNPATGSSVVTFTASASATLGESAVTITGASGDLSTITSIALTVSAPPSFTLAPSAPTLSITQGSSATDTISVTDVSGFSSGVTLAASGLPNGVTADFATNPTTGSSMLTLTAASTAATGTTTVTITGTSGALTASTSIGLTVNIAPSFTIAPSASTVSMTQGSNTADTITITGANGFTGNVTLAASGLPSGVTAVFGTNPTTGSSVLTLTASNSAATGTATITITGTSGTLTASTTIALTVNALPGSFTIAPSTASLSLTQGGNAADTITVTPVNGFTGSVTLTAGNLPSGVSAIFGTNPTSGSSQVTFSATSTAATGTTTVTVTGTSNALTASTTVSLTVNASVAAGFTLSSSPASVSVAQGASGTSTISVMDVGGFTGGVALTAQGLPDGVTAAFGTNPATGSSALTFTASGTASIGTSMVTVNGASGALTASTTVALTVTSAPTFSGSTGSTTSITIEPGATTGNTATITVASQNGFAGTVNLSCAITPAAANDPATCSLASNSVTLSSGATSADVLTVNTTAATSAENQMKKLLWPSTGGMTLALVLLFRRPRRRRYWLAMFGLLAVSFCIGAMGCGGSSGGGGGGGGGNPGTTAGAYTVTVTGTSGTQSVTLATISLTVQ
ncbi:MAG: hypothetical protein ABR923_22920 [Terracidiphilus sp.]